MNEIEPTPTEARPPRRRRVLRALLVLVLLGGGAGGYFYYRKVSAEKEAAAKKAVEAKRKPQATLVKVARTRKVRLARRERYVGELAALRSVELAPKVPGRIVKLYKELGDRVHKGEVVALVDDVEIVQQIEEAKAAVAVARAQVERAEAELARNETELNRKKPLFRQELVTRQEMDNLESAVAVAKASLSLARAQAVQAEARISTLKVQLDQTRVIAPFSGRVNRRYVDPGAMVTAAAATHIYQIVTDHKILARFKVPERDLNEVPLGKKVGVLVEAYPGETFWGRVTRVSPAVEVTTRTALAEAELPSYKGRLKPGMFARVDVLWSVVDDVVLAPQRALVRPADDAQGQEVGLFLHENGMARFVKVRPGQEQADEIEVRGVPAGVEVIVEGQHGLKTGALVTLAPPAPQAEIPGASGAAGAGGSTPGGGASGSAPSSSVGAKASGAQPAGGLSPRPAGPPGTGAPGDAAPGGKPRG
jgi:RND family efflux transporter MFP subunit